MDLIADIGATNARCALVDGDGRIVFSQNFQNVDFDGIASLLERFIAQSGAGKPPARAAIAIAAPVGNDEIAMTNIGWRFRPAVLERSLGLRELIVLNDFEALAHALPRLRATDCRPIGGGIAVEHATMAVLGPGSGLGVAAAAPHGDAWIAIAGEGGHVSMAALGETEAAIVADHGDANGHCSAERLLSGPGLVRIHATLSRLANRAKTDLTAAEVTARAAAGDPVASATLDVFCAMLGTVAGNLALTVGARGGVFIAGGIVPRILRHLEQSAFRERFVAKGRYRAYLDRIPTAIVTVEQPAFIGLRALLAEARSNGLRPEGTS
jgi:glucokinase